MASTFRSAAISACSIVFLSMFSPGLNPSISARNFIRPGPCARKSASAGFRSPGSSPSRVAFHTSCAVRFFVRTRFAARARSFLTAALVGITPQQNQGWHVTLTVNTDGAQGSDVKHKVFWVQDCAGETHNGGHVVHGSHGKGKTGKGAEAKGSRGSSSSRPAARGSAAKPGTVSTAKAARPVKAAPSFTG